MSIRIITALFVLMLASGCLVSSVEAPKQWNIEHVSERKMLPKSGRNVARLLLVETRAPYSAPEISVLRSDGSMAFDSYNVYAGAPVQLIKALALEALEASGIFSEVVSSGSSVDSDIDVEVAVKKLALDCRVSGTRRAISEISVRFVRRGTIVANLLGAGAADATDGNYSAAFSKAVSEAFEDAFKRLANESL
jgi:ABC-type uncharacterized transport system auxiliary subunit